MKKSYNLIEVFTPSQPASLTYVDRTKISKSLDMALKTPGKQIVLYGYSGSGKTTLIKQKLKESKTKSVATQCMMGMTFRDLITDAFNQLDVYYKKSIEASNSDAIGGSISANFLSIKASLNAENGKTFVSQSTRAVDLPITPQSLVQFFGFANCCWIIEDFHKIEEKEKIKLSQIMKIFMDASVQFKETKIIAIGAVKSAREIIKYDHEMKNRLAEIEVPLMSRYEIEGIIRLGATLLNVFFKDSVIDKIVLYSSGLASLAHEIALQCCNELDIDKTQVLKKSILDKHFDAAIKCYLYENSDSFRSTYDQATLIKEHREFDNPIEILNAIVKLNSEHSTVQSIAKEIKNKFPKYNDIDLKKNLIELTTPERCEILRYDKDSDSYIFANPFIKTYVYLMMDKQDIEKLINNDKFMDKLRSIAWSEVIFGKEQFLQDYDDADFSNDGDN